MKGEFFGTLPSGDAVERYVLKNGNASLAVLTFGAILQDFCVFGKHIVCGFDTLTDYLKDTSHQGGTIGRVANRIKGARLVLDGREYNFPKNDGENCLHGGCGFDRRLWTVTEYTGKKIVLEYTAEDGEEGFPANVNVSVAYTLLDTGFAIEYRAVPDGKTPISLTNHSYFNLGGIGNNIEGHRLTVFADTYTEVDEKLIPTGNRPDVTGTVFDLRDGAVIRDKLSQDFIGYDHNFNLNPKGTGNILGRELPLAATVEASDLRLNVYTDRPALQVYIGNFLGGGPAFFGSIPQVYHGAICLEAQTEPNSIQNGTDIYDKGDEYRQFTAYTVEKI